MKLAINYSYAAANLVRSGKIDIDFFKTADWDWMVREATQLRPVAVHFTLEAGNGNLGEVDWENVKHLSQITGTPFINLHLDARQNTYPSFSVDTTIPSEVDQVMNTILSDVMNVVEQFGSERVIIENSPYRAEEGNTMQLCVLPHLITQVVNDTGCGLLLDISHAIVTGKSLAMSPDEYISQLPIGVIREMHFAGVQQDQITGQWIDHLAVQETDWRLLDWVLAHMLSGEWNCPWMLSFEYGGVGEPFEWRTDPQVIAEQVPQLRERVHQLDN